MRTINFYLVIDIIPSSISSLLPSQLSHITPDYVNCNTEKNYDTEAIVAM